MADKTETEALVNRDQLLNPVHDIVNHPIALVPAGTVEIDLEKHLAVPLTKRSNVTMQSAESFIRYVGEHKQPSTRIFACVDGNGATFNCILDYHEVSNGSPRRGQHRVSYALKHSVEWVRWKGKDGVKFSQKEFARFLEDNLIDIATPPGAEVLDMVTQLEATTTVKFKQGVRLANGDEELSFQKTTVANAGETGSIVIPPQLVLSIPVFENQGATDVALRLRYQINDAALSFTFEIVRPHKLIEVQITRMIAEIKTGTGIEPFKGSATLS